MNCGIGLAKIVQRLPQADMEIVIVVGSQLKRSGTGKIKLRHRPDPQIVTVH